MKKSMVRQIIVGVLIGIAIVAAGYWGYHQYVRIKGPKGTAFEAIGKEVVFFIRTSDVRSSIYKLTKETNFWPEVAREHGIRQWQHHFQEMDSLLSRHPQLNEILELQPFVLSYQQSPDDRYGFLCIVELPRGEPLPVLEDFIRSEYGEKSIVLKKKYQKAEIVTVNLTESEALFYFTVFKGLFIGSFQEPLVQQTIGQLKSRDSWLRDELFTRVHSTAGKNVDGNIYVHLPHFYSWIKKNTAADPSQIDRWNVPGYWLEFDVLVHKDAVLFSGYTITPDTGNSVLDNYIFESAQVNIPEILPQGVNWMVHKALPDADNKIASFSPATNKTLQKNYQDTYGFDPELLYSWLGTELASVSVVVPSGMVDTLVVVHTGDAAQAVLSLQEISRKTGNAGSRSLTAENYLDYPIRSIAPGPFYRELFGEFFPVIASGWYISLKDYIVLSKTKSSLKHVIDQFYQQKTLVEYGNYQSFSDNLSDRSNLYLFSRFEGTSGSLIPGIFLKEYPGFSRFLSSVDAVALQFSYFNRMFYSNAFLQFQPEGEVLTLADWNISLGENVELKPGIVHNHRSGKKNLLVADAQNTLYLIDHVGRVQWKLELVERPLSDFYSIDFYGNGKKQYLFNTENYVYLIDLNGNYVSDFPKKLLTPASGPMVLFDYESDGDFRIVVPLRDNRIYNFDKNLEPVKGWNLTRASGTVESKVQHLVKGDRDFIFISDATGKVIVVNRRGNERIPGPLRVDRAKNSLFFLNRTNSKGDFLTTDSRGTVVYVDEAGKTTQTRFGQFSPDHYFFYTDFDSDDHHDFIYLDQDSLMVYNRFKRVVLREKLEGNTGRHPVLFRWGGRTYLAVLLFPSGEIRIYDSGGRRFQDQLLQGSAPFIISSLEEGQLNLITGQDRQILKYRLY
jgi:hypothetical protein